MDRSELFQATTLWFVAAIFLEVEPGGTDGPVTVVAAVVAIAVLYLVPLYVLLGLGITFRAR